MNKPHLPEGKIPSFEHIILFDGPFLPAKIGWPFAGQLRRFSAMSHGATPKMVMVIVNP